MAIKSHKYIPRSILRHFSERDKNNHYMIYYITSDSNKINARSIKSFNTENGYYSGTNEKILAKEEEEPLGAFIHNFSSQVNKKEISENNIVALRRYLSYQMLRSDFLIEQIKKKLHLQDEIKKIKNDLIQQEKITSVINKIVERMDVMILINQHENGFLVPLNTIISLNPNSGDDYVIVQILSPKIAVAFMAEGSFKLLGCKNKGKIEIFNITKDCVDFLNRKAFLDVKSRKNDYLIGKKQDLNSLLQQINQSENR